MNTGIKFRQRDIVIMPVVYSDLKKVKRRPVLVLSNQEYNKKSEDFICCSITSNLESIDYSVKIDSFDLEEGTLNRESIVKSNKIYTLKQSLAFKKIGVLNSIRTKKVFETLNKILE